MGAGPKREAWAAGIALPGGGHLYNREPARFAATAAAFGLTGVLWFGTGNHVAPPLVWAGSAALAAKRAGGRSKHWRGAPFVVGAAVAATAFELVRERRQQFKEQKAQAAAANELLDVTVPPLRGADRPDVHAIDEMDEIPLALTRRFVDMAFKPLDDWSDWDVIEQFQTAAVRYQVDHMIYTLALQKYTRTPAFRGYQDAAMARLVEKYQQKKVWSYWAVREPVGQPRVGPRSGPQAEHHADRLLRAVAGRVPDGAPRDFRHQEVGSIEFVWNEKRRYPYSYDTLCASLTSDYLKSPWGLVVCEPNWIFSPCNMRGAAGLRIHDRLHGTHYWDMIKDGYYRGMEQEFVRPDGTLNFYRSARTGIGLASSGFATDLRPTLPHVADRAWTMLRAAYEERDGKLVTPLWGSDKLLDTGNYVFHPLKAYAYLVEEAREVGDDEAADAAWDEVQQRVDMKIDDRGWLTVDGASMAAHLAIARSLNGRKSGWLDLITRGMPEAWAQRAADGVRALSGGDGLARGHGRPGARRGVPLHQRRRALRRRAVAAAAERRVRRDRRHDRLGGRRRAGAGHRRGGAQRAAGAAARAEELSRCPTADGSQA